MVTAALKVPRNGSESPVAPAYPCSVAEWRFTELFPYLLRAEVLSSPSVHFKQDGFVIKCDGMFYLWY